MTMQLDPTNVGPLQGGVEFDRVPKGIPRHDLSETEMNEYEQQLVNLARQSGLKDGIYAAWINSSNPLADIVRTYEGQIFPEIPEIMEPFEDQSVFLALVDTRPETERVVHAFRLSSLAVSGKQLPEQSMNAKGIGIALIDDILDSDQGLDLKRFMEYYGSRGVDISKCVSVETNFRIGEKVTTENGLRVSDLGYIAIFQVIEKLGAEIDKACVFAHLNDPAILSLGAIGVKNESIAGMTDLRTPTVGEKKFDDAYRPVSIPVSAENVEVFKQLVPFAAPEIEIV